MPGRWLQWWVGLGLCLLAVFGPGGRELAARLVGAGQPDFYAGEVDHAMQLGARQLAAARSGS